MAKKKTKDEETVEPKHEVTIAADIERDSESAAASATAAESVLEEVQAFLAQRAELARKLAEEIEATERKLATLRQTAALLVTPAGASAVKDKKGKKASKPKPAPRMEEPAPEASETPATEQGET